MKRAIQLPLLLLTTFLSMNACGQTTFDERMEQLYQGTVPLIRPKALSALDHDKIVLLDIRSDREFNVSHISKARLIDYDNFDPAQVEGISKKAKVVVYCSVGVRSEQVGEQLLKLGFKDVSNLYGGIFAWKNEGFTVVDSSNKPTDQVHTYNRNWSKWLEKGEKVYE